MALPNRWKGLNSTHQNAGTSPPTRKPTQATGQTSPTGGRDQKKEEIRPCSLGKGDLKHSKLNKIRKQRNILQMKEQGKNPQDQINEEEIGNIPEKEFRVTIVKMIQIEIEMEA